MKPRTRAAVQQLWVSPLSLATRHSAHFGSRGPRWAALHTGDDYPKPAGTQVRAIGTGTVISAGWDGSYGNKVVVRHTDGTQSWYAHLSRITVSPGQRVHAGSAVGLVGSTGNATGPHLHLEIRTITAQALDPCRWLKNRGVALA